VLVLDEPTNDLDIETLDVLEALLTAFTGTLLLVSHDRAFLDAVVSSTLVFEGKGVVREYVGGYTDWLRQRPVPAVITAAPTKRVEVPTGAKPKKRKLSYKETQELAELPDRISASETELEQGYVALADPAVVRDPATLGVVRSRVAELESAIPAMMARWEELETIASE
jgi:ATP-binding cassette subfamily F protein uup